MLKIIYRSENQQAKKGLGEPNRIESYRMLKTILTFSGVELLSKEELKKMSGIGQAAFTIPRTPIPYRNSCVMVSQDLPIIALKSFPGDPTEKL